MRFMTMLAVIYVLICSGACESDKSALNPNQTAGKDQVPADTTGTPQDTTSVPEWKHIPNGMNGAFLPVAIGNRWVYDYEYHIVRSTDEAWDIYADMTWEITGMADQDTFKVFTVQNKVQGMKITYVYGNDTIPGDTLDYSKTTFFDIIMDSSLVHAIQYPISWNYTLNNDLLRHFKEADADTLKINADEYLYDCHTDIVFVVNKGLINMQWDQASNTWVREKIYLKSAELVDD